MFIVFEGIDGSGKTSQMDMFKGYLHTIFKDKNIITTAELHSMDFTEKLGQLVLGNEVAAKTELLIMSAARAETMHKVIKPALDAGHIVLCDRYMHSTYAYQYFMNNLDLGAIKYLNSYASDDIMPDITFLLDISADEAIKRVQARNEKHKIKSDKYDSKDKEYFHKLRVSYLSLVPYYQEMQIVDAHASKENVHKKIVEIFTDSLL